jgi:hypothetical protein
MLSQAARRGGGVGGDTTEIFTAMSLSQHNKTFSSHAAQRKASWIPGRQGHRRCHTQLEQTPY